ncbi:hypothetical protein DM800_29105 [Bacillus sp. AY18-3]|uniref:hypothetical protein n=1 Tax=Bacillus sp. AY18-3 TaxID=2217814 RepID=UPI0011C830F3|nr:hypothetical protein [Bacillus sp. AY18-3]TXR58999.1 hypothetical protein DM800_29105 [Bacillus sp. AY18-3]
MRILRSKTTCVAIGANIIFCIALYIYYILDEKYINITPGGTSDEDIYRNFIYLSFALIIPLVISIVFSIIALYKEDTSSKILFSNLLFSMIFLTLCIISFVCTIVLDF